MDQRPAPRPVLDVALVAALGERFLAEMGGAMSTSTRLWPTLEQVRRQQELMDRMVYTVGVDVNTAVGIDGGLAFLEARAKCRYCSHEKSCRDWLESTKGVRPSADFCPNASFFLSCRTIDG